jgi:ABC-type proline/glycine betaine transport system permease subunit
MEIIQVIAILLLFVPLIGGFGSIVAVIASRKSSLRQIVKSTSTEIERIAAEGERAMDDLSEQYLNKLYEQITY